MKSKTPTQFKVAAMSRETFGGGASTSATVASGSSQPTSTPGPSDPAATADISAASRAMPTLTPHSSNLDGLLLDPDDPDPDNDIRQRPTVNKRQKCNQSNEPKQPTIKVSY
jgi:hypothetical protein